jgi:hypothetical protein
VLSDTHTTYHTSLLDASLALKKSELAWVNNVLTPKVFVKPLVLKVCEIFEEKKSH